MTNKDLLKEAIADAKAVKETAIANAKLALEEAFTPHLKSMLSAKLEEMDKDDDKMEEEVAEAMDDDKKVDEYGSMKKYGEDDMKKEEKEEMDEAKEELDEIDLDELLAELDLDEDKRTDAEQEGYEDGFKDAKKDIEDKLKDMKVSEAKDEDDKMEEAMKADDKDDVKEDARTDAEEEGYLDGMKDEKEDMEDDMRDEEIDLEDMSEDDLKGFIEDVIKDMVSAGEIEPGDEFVEDEVDVEDVDVEVEIDEMAHKDDEVKEEKEEMDEGHSRVKGEYGVGNEDGDRDDSKIEKETERMRFKEAMEEIQSLKEELSEVNLLNAKLLYTNKIFKAKNLTESKKVKVLKAFDKAKDVRQAKTIYETLSDGLLDKSKSQVNESVKGSASKATGIEPKAQKQPIIEPNDVYNRMRKLAGLI